MEHRDSFQTKNELRGELNISNNENKIYRKKNNQLEIEKNLLINENKILINQNKTLVNKVNNIINLRVVVDEQEKKIYRLITENNELKKINKDINLKCNSICKIINDLQEKYEIVVKEKEDVEVNYSYLYEKFNKVIDVINDDIEEPSKKRRLT
jgi:hypothetical protein